MAMRPQVVDRHLPHYATARRLVRSLHDASHGSGFGCRAPNQSPSHRVSQSRQCRPTGRLSGGYTLLELLLVLVVLVMIMAVAWPALTRRLSHHELREAGMQVAEAIAETRMNAMDSGEPWVFRYWPNTGRYESGPLFRERMNRSVTTPSDNSSAAATVEDSPNGPTSVTATESQDGTSIATGATMGQPPSIAQAGFVTNGFVLQTRHPGSEDHFSFEEDSAPFDEQATASGLRVKSEVEPGWTKGFDESENLDLSGVPARWVIFDPLGKTEDFEVIVATLDQRASLAVRVRGVTGTVSLGEPQRVIDETGVGEEGVERVDEEFNSFSSVGQSGDSAGRSDTRSFNP